MPYKQLQNQLRESELKYRRLFEVGRDGILLVDPLTGKITDANPAMTELLGYSHKELVGKELFEIGFFEDRAACSEMFKKLKKDGDVHAEEISSTNRSGKPCEIKITANLYHDEDRAVVHCNVRDITERKRAEQELFESNQRLQALMNALPVGVNFSSDTTCEVITGNPAMLRYLDMQPGDNISASTSEKKAVGRKLRHFSGGRELTPAELPMQRAISENRITPPMEIEAHLPNGTVWTHEATAAPIRDAKGKVIASVAVNVDVTERKKVEASKELERLLTQERLKTDFIADATHELRTPLAIIKGNVDLAVRGMNKKNPEYEAFQAIDAEVVHLAKLLSDLTLLTTQGQDFQRKISTRTVDLSDLLEGLAKRHENFAKKKNISIRTKLSPKLAIVGDENYLEKLFSNIIANAIRYGKDGGSVIIRGSKDTKSILIEIEDTGIGISSHDLPHIFDRFYRAESSRSKDYGGTGLGLAIVKWIAEAHGGAVGAESTEGVGSKFFVSFPVVKNNQ